MSNPQHTLGPWVVKYFDDGDCLAVVNVVTRRQVADCGPWGRGEQENECNAALIAAAPELLAENDRLRAQRDALLEACDAAWTNYGRRGDISATSLEKMEAAIASARERQ